MTQKRAMVLASGGIDSTACLFYYRELGHEVEAIFVDYGHPANSTEWEYVSVLCKQFKIPLSLLKLSGTSMAPGWEIRGRNAFLLFTALMAKPNFTGLLSLGIHRGCSYYDCGQKFVNAMKNIINDYTQGTVQLDLPLLDMDKATIVQYSKLHGGLSS
jgi:7-cyano-7-deazaguanine synthase